MYLKSLEIYGFKSFAEKVKLDFLAPKNGKNSITTVVGPNGSGKSNVVDAIRWVMGEQSMKMLRGKKGEDIIFAGSESKGQMGMASVTLTLDNSDKRTPIDYAEVIITRRYYRSGDSDYLLNGNQVRLLDLQLLLAKAQFGQGSYSLIGQGMIDRMLLQSSQERKDFFDEACGIKEFQIKRHQATLKMYRTKENIEQAELLLNEVSPHLRSLSRQVKKLEQRQEIEINLREAQEQYFFTLNTKNQEQLQSLSIELGNINKNYQEVNNRLESVQIELAGLAKEESRQDIFDNLQKKYQEILREKNILEKDRAILQGKLQAEYTKVGKQNIGWLENKIEEKKYENEKVAHILTEAEELVEKATKEILQKKREIDNVLIERAELKGKIANVEQKMLQAKSEQNYLQYSGVQAVQAILQERHRLGNVYGTVAQLGEVAEKYREALDVAAGGHLTSIVVDTDRTAQSCIEYLRRQQLGVATFLPLNKIKPRFQSQDIQNFLEKDGVHGFAVDLISFDQKFDNIFSYVLGNTLIVENVDIAREIGIGRVRMVTLEGDILEISGSMKGGFRRKEKQKGMSFTYGDSPYLRESEISNFEEKLLIWQEDLLKIEKKYNDNQEQLLSLQSQVQVATSRADMFGTQKQELDKELAALEQELSLYTMSPEEYHESMKNISLEKDQLEERISIKDKELLEVSRQMEDFNRAEEEKKKRIFVLQEMMQEEQKKLNVILDERNEKQVDIAKLETRQENLNNEVYQELHCSLQTILEKGVEIVSPDQLEELQQKIQKLKYQLSLIGGIDDEVVEEYKETKKKHDYLTTQLDDLQKAMKDLEQLIKELDEMMKKKRDKAFKQIKKEFARYFEILFEGGKADLTEVYGEVKLNKEGEEEMEEDLSEVLEESKEIIESKNKKQKMLIGIEVTACPPGKKIKNIQALSGGERTLTSIALVCAILHTNPPPFVVLDEVEAALDEANTLRFTKILHELSMLSQFIVITHNRVTMHAADALYGVTMGNDGISHLLSVDLSGAKELSE